MTRYKLYIFCLFWLATTCFMTGDVFANEETSSKIEEVPETKQLLNDFSYAMRTKNYTVLKRYTRKYKTIEWTECGPTDGEPLKYSVSVMMNRMKHYSTGTQIYIDDNPEIVTLSEGTAPFIDIETEGWAIEYPYLVFSFQYDKSAFGWQWVGVCYSSPPPFIFTNRGLYEQRYKRTPILPRPGPRLFKDYYALRDRFKEIVNFKALDALKPYAVKQKLILNECNREMAASGKITGTKVSSDQIVDFLKKNIGASQEIKPTKGGADYLDTEGWQGAFPYVAFWFQESKKGWEWSGVTYCKSSLMHVMFPDEPRFK